jgi:hypothetical protein
MKKEKNQSKQKGMNKVLKWVLIIAAVLIVLYIVGGIYNGMTGNPILGKSRTSAGSSERKSCSCPCSGIYNNSMGEPTPFTGKCSKSTTGKCSDITSGNCGGKCEGSTPEGFERKSTGTINGACSDAPTFNECWGFKAWEIECTIMSIPIKKTYNLLRSLI